MATRNTLYVIRVGTETPQGDGYTYLRWCDGKDYRWADLKGATQFHGRKAAEDAALAILRAMRARGNNPPTDYVLRDFFGERGFEPRDVVVSAGGCSIFFALDTIAQES